MKSQDLTKWILGCTLFLQGCTVSLSEKQQRENLITQPSLETSIAKSASTPYFAKGEWPQEAWWETFQSQELNALIAEALVRNPTLNEVESRVSAAAQEAVIARSPLFPLVFFKGDIDWQYLSKHGLYRAFNPKIPLNAYVLDLALSFTYEFDFWGKNRHLFMAALGEVEAAYAESRQVELIVTTALAQSYFALKTNLIRKKLYEKLYAVRSGINKLNEILKEKALLAKFSPLESKEKELEAKEFLAGIEDEIAQNRHLINVLVGRGPDCPLSINDNLPPFPEKLLIPETLSIELIARRPDLLAELWRAKALAERVGAAIADFLPNFNLRAFVGLQSTSFSKLFNFNSQTIGIEPAFSLPIFTAGAIRANVRGTKALFDEAVFRYNGLVLKSVQEVADLLSFAESVFSKKKEQEGIVSSARERYRLTVLRQQKGLNSYIPNYNVEEELIQKELDDTILLYDQYVAAIKLIKALGGGYCTPYLPLQGGECR